MELILKPFSENSYPKKGILIKSSSPFAWLAEMDFLEVDINQVKAYAIPSNEPNVLYGCLLVFDHIAPKEIGRNSYFQCVNDKLFIPENTIVYPKINPEDWQNIQQEYLIMHPDFGLVKLAQEIDWISLLQESEKSNDVIRKASKGVKIPQKIESFAVEINDDKILEELQNPKNEEEWMKDLPFDLKKVMAGNKKEIEKYLQYLDKYPDRAADLGVPLDIAGTSRGDGFAKYRFGGSWLSKLFGNHRASSEGGGKSDSGNLGCIFPVIIIVMLIARVTLINFNKNETRKQSSGDVQTINKDSVALPPPAPVIGYKSGVTDIDLKIDSMYGKKRQSLIQEFTKASMFIGKKDEKSYQDYLKEGGRPIKEIQDEVMDFEDKTFFSKDSLKLVYRKKIEKYLVQNEEKFKKKIQDSLKKSGSGIPADQGVVSTLLKKKKVLVEDSLGRLLGTKEYPDPPMDPSKKGTAIKSLDKEMPYSKQNVSLMEMIYLVAGIIGIVGLYSYFFRKKSLSLGGDNVPLGIKIFLMVVLVAMLVYIFFPLIEMFGYNWFVWILVICIILLLYRLFSEDKNILKSDKDE
ncbi:APC family permease [Chryseobacterium sp. KACC 21268]|nr:APC family permease [Chryseobacterium sp. KACC 21268]